MILFPPDELRQSNEIVGGGSVGEGLSDAAIVAGSSCLATVLIQPSASLTHIRRE